MSAGDEIEGKRVGWSFGSMHPKADMRDGLHVGAMNTTGVAFVVEPLFLAVSPDAAEAGARRCEAHDQINCTRASYAAGVKPRLPRGKVRKSGRHTGFEGVMESARFKITKPLPGH